MKYHHWAQASLSWWICPCNKALWIKMVIRFQLTVLCLLCVFVHTGLMRTVKRSLWLLEADRIMITCTGCTCPVSTAAAAATAARPASLQEHTLSATLLLLSSCEVKHTHTCMTSTTNTYEHIQVTLSVLWRIHGVFCRISLIFSLTDTSYWCSHIFYYISFWFFHVPPFIYKW